MQYRHIAFFANQTKRKRERTDRKKNTITANIYIYSGTIKKTDNPEANPGEASGHEGNGENA
jgi:hypothetical protein